MARKKPDLEDNNNKNRKVKKAQDKYKEERQAKAQHIQPKTLNQSEYLSLLQSKQLVIAIGPAGTGKSFCSAAFVSNQLLRGEIEKVIIARPYVQMGKSIGAVPGDEVMKLGPYVRPLTDVITRKTQLKLDYLLSSGKLEIQPLESIRGRSFDDRCTLILDESQNSTPEEMKAIISRCSDQAQILILGDAQQKDIKGQSGLEWVVYMHKKYNFSNTGIVEFTSDDIVRGGLVKEFIQACEKEYE